MNHTQKFIVSRAGNKIAVYDWLYSRREAPRAAVLLMHNYAEYALHLQRLAQKLVHWGFIVRSFDFYAHHESEGKKGTIPHLHQYEHDAADVAADWKAQLPPGTPLLIWGWGMGALVGVSAQVRGEMDADAYCLASPLLRIPMSMLERTIVLITRKLFPNAISAARIKPEEYSQDAEYIMLMKHDSRMLDVISLRIIDSIDTMIKNVMEHAEQWHKPTLLMYGGKDTAIDIQGTKDFLMATNKTVEVKLFPDMMTDLFNETGKEEVYTRLQQWLDKRYPLQKSSLHKSG